MRDLYSNITAIPALAAAVQTAAGNGATIDTLGAGRLAFVVNTGAADGNFGVKLQESDTGTSGWTDVAADQVDSTAPAVLAANTAYRLGYRGWKRYVRLALTKGGGTSIAAGAVAVVVPQTRPAA